MARRGAPKAPAKRPIGRPRKNPLAWLDKELPPLPPEPPAVGEEALRAAVNTGTTGATFDHTVRMQRISQEIGLTPEQIAEAKARIDEQARQADAKEQLRAVERLLKIRASKNSLIDFTQLMMPVPEDPDDATKSRYDAQYFHRAIAAALEEVEAGRCRKLILTIPPRHGKTRLASNMFPAWYIGRDPYRSFIFGTYNQPFADDQGREVRGILTSPLYSQVFPEVHLRKGEAASDRLKTEEGGLLAFVGRGGTITGRGADLIVIDDPIKGTKEADSPTIRDELWKWYQNDIISRFMTDEGVIIIIQTRWHEDDLVGRLTNPENPYYDPHEAAQWKIINIPAIAEVDDVLGRKVGEALWPTRFSVEHLEHKRKTNPRGFASLYQQRPSPEDGDYFKASMFRTYNPGELPDRLRIYVGSDHAVGKKQRNDETCILIAGVCDKGVAWLLDCWWQRADTYAVTEAMLKIMQTWHPITWWSGKDHITKSIGPFLRKRMLETNTFVSIVELPDNEDKEQKAQSFQGRMSMGMVRFPKAAWWYERARDQMLKFPNGTFNDFVDAGANLGRGLPFLHGAGAKAREMKGAPKVGTLGWVKAAHNQERKAARAAKNLRSM